MVINILAFSFLYMGGSFILTALYVRFRNGQPLALYYRKNFALFPSFPVIMFFRLGLWPFRLMASSARDLFEFLSGKPTYHRRKTNYYGRRRKLRRWKVDMNDNLKMGRNIPSKSQPRPRLVSDNGAPPSEVPKVVSKY